MRVLLIEDDPAVRALLEDVLALRGHAVEAFGEAESAWVLCQRELLPLVVLDWMLPGIDGLEFCRRLRSLPEGDNVLVLCLTARSAPQDLVQVLEAGADDYLAKPFDLPSLNARLTIAERQVVHLAERKRLKDALAHQALHDPLTDLPNRTLLYDRLSQGIRTAKRERRPLSLLLLDMDRFKVVNDTFGHAAGDQVLRDVARGLRGTLRQADTVARLGGDEFAVVLPGTGAAGASRAAEKILRVLATVTQTDGVSLDVGASIGIAVYPMHGRDAESLLRCADAAMYAAKRAQLGLAVYAAEQDEYAFPKAPAQPSVASLRPHT